MAESYRILWQLDSSIKTIGDFINQSNSPVKSYAGKTDDFLNYSIDTGKSNRDNIWNSYTKKVQDENPKDSLSDSSPINFGIALYSPADKVDNEILSISGVDQFLKQSDFITFFNKEYLAINNDKSYVKSNIIHFKNDKTSISLINESCQVWIYIRALDKIINVSKFIQNITTNVETIGSFSMSLNPISDISELISSGNDVINYNQIITDNQFNLPYFNKFIQQNDIVFIRFEKLEIEKDSRDKLSNQIEISKEHLPNQIYDMIGLVDNNSLSYNASEKPWE